MALARLLPSALIISAIIESLATSDAVAVDNPVNTDATPELLA
jgi:hypothetical protein